MPSMRKMAGDKIKTHPENLKNLVKNGYVASTKKAKS